MLLVDTSVWIDHFNGHASRQATRLAEALADSTDMQIFVPGIVLAEILSGLRSDAEVLRIIQLLEALDSPPPFDRGDYIAASSIFRTCRRRGETVCSLIDCLIAQLCLRYEYSLLSADRDFAKIARCYPLRLETV